MWNLTMKQVQFVIIFYVIWFYLVDLITFLQNDNDSRTLVLVYGIILFMIKSAMNKITNK